MGAPRDERALYHSCSHSPLLIIEQMRRPVISHLCSSRISWPRAWRAEALMHCVHPTGKAGGGGHSIIHETQAAIRNTECVSQFVCSLNFSLKFHDLMIVLLSWLLFVIFTGLHPCWLNRHGWVLCEVWKPISANLDCVIMTNFTNI